MQDAKTDTFTLWAYWHGSQTVRQAWYKYKYESITLVCVLKQLSGHLTDMIQILESIAWVCVHVYAVVYRGCVCIDTVHLTVSRTCMIYSVTRSLRYQSRWKYKYIPTLEKKKWCTFLFYSIEWLPIALIKSWLLSVWPRCKYLPYFSGYYFLRSRHPSPSFYPDPTSVNPPVQPLCISASSAMQLWCRKMYILKQNAKPPEKNLHFCFRANCPGTFFTTLAFFETL